jgi:hypothetical protein
MCGKCRICGRKVKARGLCQNHYIQERNRKLKTGEWGKVKRQLVKSRQKTRLKDKCNVCGLRPYAHHLCRKHYDIKRHIDFREEKCRRSKEWYQAHKKRANANSKQWVENNRKKSREIKERWRKNNPEKVRAAYRRRYAKNPQHFIEKQRRYYRNNTEKCREAAREWRNILYLNKSIAMQHNRRAKHFVVPGVLTEEDVRQIREKTKGICPECKLPFPLNNYGNQKISLHHKIPMGMGGQNIISNILTMCESCHQKLHHHIKKTQP